MKLAMRALSAGVRRRAKGLQVRYSFSFMRANGDQPAQIIDRVFPFDSTNEALAYVETGRARGKVVINVR